MKIKKKKFKSYYAKRITTVLAAYVLYMILCIGIPMTVVFSLPEENSETAACIGVFVLLALILGGSAAMIFGIIPKLKRTQAKTDFAESDFTPYISCGEREIFYQEYHICRYTFTVSPFDSDESILLSTEKELDDYMSQFAHERYLSSEYKEHPLNSSPFFIAHTYSPDEAFKDGVTIRVEKLICGSRETVDLYDIHRAEFSDDGVRVGEKLYPYEEATANIVTGFCKETGFTVCARMLVFLADDGYISFKLTSRIAAIADRFGIQVNNRDILDYFLADPARAYEQTALQLGLKKLK